MRRLITLTLILSSAPAWAAAPPELGEAWTRPALRQVTEGRGELAAGWSANGTFGVCAFIEDCAEGEVVAAPTMNCWHGKPSGMKSKPLTYGGVEGNWLKRGFRRATPSRGHVDVGAWQLSAHDDWGSGAYSWAIRARSAAEGKRVRFVAAKDRHSAERGRGYVYLYVSPQADAMAVVALVEEHDTCQTLSARVWRLPEGLARGLNIAGLRHHMKKRYAPAIERYDAALALAPDFTVARYNKACAHALAGDKAAALAALDKVLAADPSHWIPKAKGDKDLKSLSGDPDFDALLARHAAPRPERPACGADACARYPALSADGKVLVTEVRANVPSEECPMAERVQRHFHTLSGAGEAEWSGAYTPVALATAKASPLTGFEPLQCISDEGEATLPSGHRLRADFVKGVSLSDKAGKRLWHIELEAMGLRSCWSTSHRLVFVETTQALPGDCATVGEVSYEVLAY